MTYTIMGQSKPKADMQHQFSPSFEVTTTHTLEGARRALNRYRSRFPNRWRFWIKGEPKDKPRIVTDLSPNDLSPNPATACYIQESKEVQS